MTSSKKIVNAMLFVLLTCVLFIASGCHATGTRAGETYRESTIAWPLFDVHKTAGQLDNGETWRREKGDVLILANWDKEKRYDADGNITYRKDTSVFFPIYYREVKQGDAINESKFNFLMIFPLYSKTEVKPEN